MVDAQSIDHGGFEIHHSVLRAYRSAISMAVSFDRTRAIRALVLGSTSINQSIMQRVNGAVAAEQDGESGMDTGSRPHPSTADCSLRKGQSAATTIALGRA